MPHTAYVEATHGAARRPKEQPKKETARRPEKMARRPEKAARRPEKMAHKPKRHTSDCSCVRRPEWYSDNGVPLRRNAEDEAS